MSTRQPNRPPAPARNIRWPRYLPFLAVAGIVLASGGLFYGIHLENNDAFCASCHTQPESQYYQRSQAAAVDLASVHAAKNVACIDCHSGPGPLGRVGAIKAVAAPDLVAYLSGHYRNPAITTVPIGDDHCLKCHADIAARQSFDNHFHVFLSQWQARAPQTAATCVDCHQSHVTGGLPKVAFLQESSTVAVCQRCHAFAGTN